MTSDTKLYALSLAAGMLLAVLTGMAVGMTVSGFVAAGIATLTFVAAATSLLSVVMFERWWKKYAQREILKVVMSTHMKFHNVKSCYVDGQKAVHTFGLRNNRMLRNVNQFVHRDDTKVSVTAETKAPMVGTKLALTVTMDETDFDIERMSIDYRTLTSGRYSSMSDGRTTVILTRKGVKVT